MASRKRLPEAIEPRYETRPPVDDEERMNECISLAYDCVRERLRTNTASAQEVCLFLKMGSDTEKQEKVKLEEEIKLLKAKTAALEAQKNSDTLYKNAIIAMKVYSGNGDEDDEELLRSIKD